MFFDRFIDAKKVCALVAQRYDKDYLTGMNFIVKNGQYFLVMFFDVSEVIVSQLENFLASVLKDFDYHIPKVTDDKFWMRLLDGCDFSALGDSENIIKLIPSDWDIYAK